MMSLGELQISFPLFFVPKIHLMTSYPETLTAKKLIKLRILTIKIHYILLRMIQILHIPKIIFGVSRTLSFHCKLADCKRT
jgi:hypothetical protein